jgi:hypothetical protein
MADVIEDIPQKGLLRGPPGAVVESLAPGVYEVEFNDDSAKRTRLSHSAASLAIS